MSCDVVIPSLLRDEKAVVAAIESVASQRVQPLEVVLVNTSGSPWDCPPEVSAKLSIKVVDSQVQGAGAARNVGIEHCTADFVAFLDDDDLWLPDHLACAEQAFGRDPGAEIFFSAGFVHRLGVPFAETRPETVASSVDRVATRGNTITSGVVVRRRALVETRFREDLVRSQDRDLWVRLLFRRSPALAGGEPTVIYNWDPFRYSFRHALKANVAVVKLFWENGTGPRRTAAVAIGTTRSLAIGSLRRARARIEALLRLTAR